MTKSMKKEMMAQSMWTYFKSEEGVVHIDIRSIIAVSEYEKQIVLHTTSRDFEVPVTKLNLKELERVKINNQNYLVQVK